MDKKIRFDLVNARKIWFLISLIVVGVGVASLVVRNLNYGVDFTGGYIIRFETGREVTTAEIDRLIEENGIRGNPAQVMAGGKEFSVRIQSYATADEIAAMSNDERKKKSEAYNKKINDLKIDFNVEFYDIDPGEFTLRDLGDKITRPELNEFLDANGYASDTVLLAGADELPRKDDQSPQLYNVNLQINNITEEDELKELVTALYHEFEGYRQFVKEDKIDPVFGVELKKKAFLALGIATICILLYVTIRFEFWFAVAAIIALIHDCLITLGFYSVLQLEVNSAFVAIILTVFGYSINDTIVIFDRIRENMRKDKRAPLDRVINRSLWETLPRSINTTLTTEVTIIAILVLGGASIKDFALGLSIGVLAGAYSSILIAAPAAYIFKSYDRARKGGQAIAGAGGPTPAGRPVTASETKPRKKQKKSEAAAASSAAAAQANGAQPSKKDKSKDKKKKKGKQRRR